MIGKATVGRRGRVSSRGILLATALLWVWMSVAAAADKAPAQDRYWTRRFLPIAAGMVAAVGTAAFLAPEGSLTIGSSDSDYLRERQAKIEQTRRASSDGRSGQHTTHSPAGSPQPFPRDVERWMGRGYPTPPPEPRSPSGRSTFGVPNAVAGTDPGHRDRPTVPSARRGLAPAAAGWPPPMGGPGYWTYPGHRRLAPYFRPAQGAAGRRLQPAPAAHR